MDLEWYMCIGCTDDFIHFISSKHLHKVHFKCDKHAHVALVADSILRIRARNVKEKVDLICKMVTQHNITGARVMRKSVSIGIPAGVEDGQTMRVQIGKQEVFITFKVRFARSKYTYFIIQVAPSAHFRRDGSDIHSDASVSVSQALLGGSINVPGIYEDTISVQVGYSLGCFDDILSDSGWYCITCTYFVKG
jgi:hypothetical protein